MSTFISQLAKRYVPAQIKGKLRQQFWQRLNLRWTVKSGLTMNVTNYADWVIYNDIFVDGEYDEPIDKLLRSVSGSKQVTVLDIGANAGFFALRLLDRSRQKKLDHLPIQMTLVEGSKLLCERLNAVAAENGLADGQMRVVHGLVGQRSGQGALFEAEFHGENSVFWTPNTRRVEVAFLDLTTLFDSQTEIDLLKCDIEGSELLFIENYPDLFKRVRSAVFELHHRLCDTERCKSLLRQAGLTQSSVLRSTDLISVCHFWRES